MSTFSKEILSGSTTGKNIKVVATATAGTLIHTSVSGTTHKDEIWLYAVNSSGSDVYLTIEFGGTSSPDDTILVPIQAYTGAKLVVPGFILQNSLVVRAFASIANVILINGYVNRITVS